MPCRCQTFCLFVTSIFVIATLPGLGLATHADDNVTVQIFLAKEHAPVNLKPGDKVNLSRVNGKTSTAGGKVSYITAVLVSEAKVTAVETIAQPASPEQAVKVELAVTKTQAATIERVKKQLVTVREANSNGTVETKKIPVPLRLELIKK